MEIANTTSLDLVVLAVLYSRMFERDDYPFTGFYRTAL
jgi:hypothetical protein